MYIGKRGRLCQRVVNYLSLNHLDKLSTKQADWLVNIMMMSSNGNIFRVTAALWGDSTGHFSLIMRNITYLGPMSRFCAPKQWATFHIYDVDLDPQSAKLQWKYIISTFWISNKISIFAFTEMKYHTHGPLARYIWFRGVHAPGMPGTFSPPRRVSVPDMHHGMCVPVPRCMLGSLTSGFHWIRWRGKRSRRMRIPQFYVSGKRPIDATVMVDCLEGMSKLSNLLFQIQPRKPNSASVLETGQIVMGTICVMDVPQSAC